MTAEERLSKEDLAKLITWSGCAQHCKGGQHVARTCTYQVGEIKDLDIFVRIGVHRSLIKNREAAIDAIYNLYLSIYPKEYAMQEKQGWVSVHDRLPDNGRDVFISDDESDIVDLAFYANGKWTTLRSHITPTMWRELPQKLDHI